MKNAVKPAEKNGKKPIENAEEDDPIAKSLKQREAAGGLNAVVGEKKVNAPVTRPQTAKVDKQPAEEKKVVAKKPVDNDDDDPIAKSLKQRMAAGGLTSVVGETKSKIRP